ncbi:hypothetical protein [Neobacillus bataviensis]|uniref:hypothetical protein n=1 Tax=Neobacillus bataviensis TaxID=220685 RepID=UPI001CBC265C|nr:hypothetical protein [Neobacillus bataviensis]
METLEKKRFSTKGLCTVEGCCEPIKARQLCNKHYVRMRRRGNTDTIRVEARSVDHCLAIDCSKPYFANGYCEHHNYIYKKIGYPHTPKEIKLCGVEDCYNYHFLRGLCEIHYYEWMSNLKKFQFNPMKEKETSSIGK